MIPDDQVEEVRARADIVDVIGQFVPLKRAGKEYKARCPFHEERTPSFCVVPDKGFFKCFGCGESGDVFGFLMKHAGMDFVDAVKHVAARSGVEIRESRDRAEEDPNRPLHELNAFARDFYRKQLLDPEVGRLARDYLEARGIDAETAERFGLGFAPDAWRALRDACSHHGFDDELMMTAGLLATSERAREPYDVFRNRVVFPIENVGGRTVAFGARVIGSDDGGRKYLNSPETPVYHKGSVLYGLSWARQAIRKEGAALLVEGYMDVVTLAASGIENVVAPLGTSVTGEQARLLGRYATKVLLLFDSDLAGQKATFRAGDVFLTAGVQPGVVTLPPREDPDTLVRKEGPAGLRHYLDQAVDVVDRKILLLEEHDAFESIEGTRTALDKLLPTLAATTDPTLRDIYVAKVADRTGVRRETLEGELSQRRARRHPGGAAARPSATRQAHRPSRATRLPPMGAERNVLLLMTRSADYVERAGEQLAPDDFSDSTFRAIFEALLADPELRAAPPDMDPAAAQRLESLLADPEDVQHGLRIFDDSVAELKHRSLGRRVADLDARLRDTVDAQERRRLAEEKMELARQRRELARNTVRVIDLTDRG